ncbi:MAG: hypothetical protein GX552_14540 [Chloroflexi bacterium]|jgi:hypothetical protein|nr:hypothetical protein [Chloroflexota bacterium]
MHARRVQRTILVLLALVLSCYLLAGCQVAGRKSDRASHDWSRGQYLGRTILNGPVGFALDPAGDAAYVAWVAATDDGAAQVVHFARLDAAGEVVTERNLPITMMSPSDVELVAGNDGQVHLLWVDRLGDERRLFYTQLDSMGELVRDAQPISLEGLGAARYDAGLAPTGELDVFWCAQEGEGAGLYHLRLTSAGEVAADNLLLAEGGFAPAFRRDQSGLAHLVWYQEPTYGRYYLHYAVFDGEARQLDAAALLTSFPAGGGLVAHRPTIGLAGSDAYVFWALERRGGGLSDPGAESYCVTFPLGRPEQAQAPRQVLLPASNYPEYGRVHTAFNVGELAGVAAQDAAAQFVYLAATSEEHGEQLAVVFSTQLDGRRSSNVQVLLTVWANGELEGYQVAGKTGSSSLRPVLRSGNGNLHVAWIDTAGFGQYDVYYASTAAAARARLNRVTAQDVLAEVADVLWAMTQAVGLIPLTFMWAGAPMIIMAIYLFITVESDLARRGPRVMLVVSILLYVFLKYLTGDYWLGAVDLPGMSRDLVLWLGALTPLIIGGLAGALTWLFMRRREYASLVQTFAIFVACDAVLTLLVYIPGILVE